MSELAPLVSKLTADVDATAKGSDATIPVGVVPFAGSVTAVSYIAVSKITGAATNSRTLKLINEGPKGEGTTVVAELALLSGVNAAALAQTALTLADAKKLIVAEDDVLVWKSEHVGEGLADVGGEVCVSIARS
jgi:hypothetical protein